MKDKFDLFERYSDDVVGEYICSFISIDNLGMYNRFSNYLTGDAIIEEVKEKLVEMFGADNVYKFSNARFIAMTRISKSKLGDFDYRDKQMQKIGEEIKNNIEPSIIVNKTLTESRKVKLRVGIASDDRMQQVQNIFLLVKIADACNKLAEDRGITYFCTNEAYIQHELERDSIRDAIELAIENSEFVPFFQPIISTSTRKIVGAETLTRWQKDTYRILEPLKFLDIAEEKELIHAIDLSVIEQTFQTMRIWIEDELLARDFIININLSLASIERINFKHIADLAKKHHLDPQNVYFELQYDVFDDKNLAEKIQDLKKYGFKVGIDNFGTSDISLNAITQAGVIDYIKLDKSILPVGSVELIHEKLYRALVHFADLIDATIIANGVETMKHVDFCTYCGIENIQGYYFSRVLGESEFRFLLEKYRNGIM